MSRTYLLEHVIPVAYRTAHVLIINTHNHFDHAGGNADFLTKEVPFKSGAHEIVST